MTKKILQRKLLSGFFGLTVVMLSFSLALACDDGSGNTNGGETIPPDDTPVDNPPSSDTPVVTGVTVNPETAPVPKGGSAVFTATVTGTNNPDQTVIWSITPSGTASGINNSGVLSVAANETTTLTVKAISSATPSVSGTATVTVIDTADTKDKAGEVAEESGRATDAEELETVIKELPGINVPEGFAGDVNEAGNFDSVKAKVKELLDAIAGAAETEVAAKVQELNDYLAYLSGDDDDDDGSGNNDDNGDDGGSSDDGTGTETWFNDKYTYYTVTDGVAGSVS